MYNDLDKFAEHFVVEHVESIHISAALYKIHIEQAWIKWYSYQQSML